jgi:hypothetical protein
MSEPLSPDTSKPVNPNVSFERQDANIRAIVVCAVGVIVLTGAVHLFISSLLGVKAPAMATAMPERLRLPKDLEKVPAPRLQVNETKELEKLRRDEDVFLDNQNRSATWVEKNKAVRVPVAEAMRLLADPKTAERLDIGARPAAEKTGGSKKSGQDK